MIRILHWLLGYGTVSFSRDFAAEILNTVREKSFEIYDYIEADGEIILHLPKKEADVLRQAYPAVCCVKAGGMPASFPALLKRPGLAIGAFLACFLVLLGSRFVWDIRVTGLDRLTEAAVTRELSAAGLSVGMAVSDLNEKNIETAVLLSSEDIAWIGVNRRGSVVFVELIEQKKPPEKESDRRPANLVAARDAVVESLAVTRGDPCVAAGHVVRRGDLLVSGVTDGQNGAHLVRAAGAVYGRVEKQFTVQITRWEEVPIRENRQTLAFSWNFFKKSGIISGDTGKLPDKYDIINKIDSWQMPDGTRLPFSFSRRSAVWFDTEIRTRTDEEMIREAIREVNQRLSLELCDAELLEKRLTGSFADDVYCLTCTVLCIENIAETVPLCE